MQPKGFLGKGRIPERDSRGNAEASAAEAVSRLDDPWGIYMRAPFSRIGMVRGSAKQSQTVAGQALVGPVRGGRLAKEKPSFAEFVQPLNGLFSSDLRKEAVLGQPSRRRRSHPVRFGIRNRGAARKPFHSVANRASVILDCFALLISVQHYSLPSLLFYSRASWYSWPIMCPPRSVTGAVDPVPFFVDFPRHLRRGLEDLWV